MGLRSRKTTRYQLALSKAEAAAIEELQERVGIRLHNLDLLYEAMSHSSWSNEQSNLGRNYKDNERLEYLGDAVLELAAAEYLFNQFPDYQEGQLTQMRASLVNTISLARVARQMRLGEALLVGKGAVKSGTKKLPSILANSLEALVGAIFLDQGYQVATKLFFENVGDLDDWSDENFKGRLQQLSQSINGSPPNYEVVASGGPGHRRQYKAEVSILGQIVGIGVGATKQAAEQVAASDALARIASALGRLPKAKDQEKEFLQVVKKVALTLAAKPKTENKLSGRSKR